MITCFPPDYQQAGLGYCRLSFLLRSVAGSAGIWPLQADYVYHTNYHILSVLSKYIIKGITDGAIK